MLKGAARLVAFGLAMSDLVAIALALPITYRLRTRFHFGSNSELAPLFAYWFLLPLVLIPWLIGLITAGSTNSHRRRSLLSEAGELLFSTVTAAVLASGLLFITRIDRVFLARNGLSRKLLGIWVVTGALLLIAQRPATRFFGLLVVLSPALLFVAGLILVHSGRPFLFRQTRMGLNGRPFTLYKFRTMVIDSQQRKIDLAVRDSVDGPVFKAHHDPRVTKIGGFLRHFSIDELPQLWNVLTGSMSLVGPRPPIPAEVEHYEPRTRRRLAMRSGMTGLWQVSGSSDIGFEACIDMDFSYIDRWSFWLDTKILLETLPAVLTAKGAY